MLINFESEKRNPDKEFVDEKSDSTVLDEYNDVETKETSDDKDIAGNIVDPMGTETSAMGMSPSGTPAIILEDNETNSTEYDDFKSDSIEKDHENLENEVFDKKPDDVEGLDAYSSSKSNKIEVSRSTIVFHNFPDEEVPDDGELVKSEQDSNRHTKPDVDNDEVKVLGVSAAGETPAEDEGLCGNLTFLVLSHFPWDPGGLCFVSSLKPRSIHQSPSQLSLDQGLRQSLRDRHQLRFFNHRYYCDIFIHVGALYLTL